MSTDLKDQIRQYAEGLESGQTPVSMTEIQGRAGKTDEVVVGFEPRVPSRWTPRGPWPALVAAVLALVVFGLLVWILPGREAAQPADTVAPANSTVPSRFPGFSGTVFYLPTAVPDGFTLRDLRTIGRSRVLYLAESGDTWLPSDGGFAVNDVSRMLATSGQTLAIDSLIEAAPGSERVTVGGAPGVILESQFSQDGVTAQLIWVVGVDDQGGAFEVSAIGMSREAVLAVADGVRNVPVDEFVDLGSEITWDVKIDSRSDGLSLQLPPMIRDMATGVQLAFGTDLLWPRLSNAGQGTTVVTSETGEIVESDGELIESNSADVFLKVPDENVDDLLAEYPGNAELSPARRDRRVDNYLDQIVGQVLSEDPYVVQAAAGPEPRFDTSALGEEIALVPARSAAVVPTSILRGRAGDPAAATPQRPVVVIGSATQPTSNVAPTVTALVWFTETGVVCQGAGVGESMGSGCGLELLGRFGFTGGTTGGDGDEIDYVVPLETSVVQLLSESGTYWQRPRGGYGVVPFGDTVSLPETIIAFDVDGNEIGRWENDIMP